MSRALALALLGIGMLAGGWSPAAQAAGAPLLGPGWSGEVSATAARLHSTVNPNGFSTHYRFDYITKAAYEANLNAGHEGFTGALKAPSGAEAPLGSGTTPIAVSQQLPGLSAETAYRDRLVAQNSAGTVASPTLSFTTQGLADGALLPDGRGWEMVSPVDKNGGQVNPPGTLAGGGVLQAAPAAGSVTYSSSASFGAGAQGAPAGSQYVARRGSGAWSTENITTPILSGSYGAEPQGVPYQLFSGDLARGLLLNPRRCGEGEACPRSYSLREGGALSISPEASDLRFVGADPDLRHVVLSTCAALTADAIEIPAGEGCNPAEANLYEWSEGTLHLVNLLPGESHGTPGARLAAQSGAVSADGSRVYFTELEDGSLYLREAGGATKSLPETVGGGANFQTASADGSVAFFTKGGHLFRNEAAGAGSSADLTPSGGVVGVLGASEDGAYLYYQDATGLWLWREGASTIQVAPGADAADAGNYPPSTVTARVSADGTRLAFLSTAPLSGYDNTDQGTGEPDSEVYLYDATAPSLTCVSCNPTEERPIGPSTIPGAIPNGQGPNATDSYKPRVLSADGRRLFFDSRDALVLADTDKAPDAYEWEAPGVGSCAWAGGCLALISSGKGEGGASFVDASADGSDAFFLTGRSLVGADPGSVDLYDARIGGGFPEPAEPIPCEGDACQVLPAEPVDPALDTLISGLGNPPVRYQKIKHRRRVHHRDHRGKRSGAAHRHRGRR